MVGTRGSRRRSTSSSGRKSRSKSPAKYTPPRTRSKAAKPKKLTPVSEKKKSPTPKKPAVKNLNEKLDTFGTDDFSHKLVVLRIQYTQLFFLGVIALAIPNDVSSKLQLKDEFLTPGLSLGLQWFGVSTIGFSMLLMAAAQGTPAEMKKALQYGMMFWIMAASLTVHQNESCKDKMDSIYGVVVCLFNLSIAIWACYFT